MLDYMNRDGYGITADVWSLGLALLELALGRHPYYLADEADADAPGAAGGGAGGFDAEGFRIMDLICYSDRTILKKPRGGGESSESLLL